MTCTPREHREIPVDVVVGRGGGRRSGETVDLGTGGFRDASVIRVYTRRR